MDYHKQRFDDFSLMVYYRDRLVALLPANRVDDVVYSHQGLSYGGIVLAENSKFEIISEAFKLLLSDLSNYGIHELRLKLLPSIYNLLPSDEVAYLLFKLNAKLERRDLAMVIDTDNRKKWSKNRQRNLKKAVSSGVSVMEETQLESFFNTILLPNLREKHQVLPTHTIEEISMLKTRFPTKIRQFNAYHSGDIIAGVTIFETLNVAHAQYISTVSAKKDLGGLDVLFDYLIHTVYRNKRFFSFGISNEKQGQHINEGLVKWKQSFGANAICHDFYGVDTKNYKLLDDMMI